MPLTISQLQTLDASIDQDGALSALENNADNAVVIAAAYNAVASPSYWVLRTSLGKHEYTDEAGLDSDGTTPTAFTWGGAAGGYIARSQGERDAFKELFNSALKCNPSLANVRTAIDDIFSGSGAGAVGNRSHFRAKQRRLCTRFERLYVVQTVGGPSQSGNRGTVTNPDTLGVVGPVTPQDVLDARSL